MNTQLSEKLPIYKEYPLHSPGCIQPHGVLLVLRPNTLEILQISGNSEKFLGIKPKSLLGKTLHDFISKDQIKKLKCYICKETPEFVEFLTIKKGSKKIKFKGIIHTAQNLLILELEPENYPENHQHIVLYSLLKNAIAKLGTTNNLAELAQNIAVEVRKITQFDRVMVYRFESDNSGVVIAENKEENLESYLDLHYPPTDIPSQARQLYCKNWLRIIPDVNYEPVEIIASKNLLNNKELDLSQAVLRSVFPCHIEYLKNMGVTASMSISIINEQKLWGLVTCHHYSPKYINYETRKACEFLGQFISINLVYKQEKEFHIYRSQVQTIQAKIRKHLSTHPRFIEDLIIENQTSLLNLVKAEGAAIYLGEQLNLIGKTPYVQDVKNLIEEFLNHQKEDIFYTDCLSKHYPKAQKFKNFASGILAISIYISSNTYHIIWFRPEQLQIIKWAGNLDESMFVYEEQIPQLTPRNSFVMWQELVKDKSLPWEILEVEAVQELRNILLLAALEFAQFSEFVFKQKAQEANAANAAKTQFLAKMSHELRTPLNAILGFAQMMNRDASLSQDQQDYLRIINRSGEHLLSLINDVLEMSRIEAGQLILNQTCFDLRNLIESVRELLSFKALLKGLELQVTQDDNLPEYVEGDEGKLRQIIVNLVGNAIKFTETGGIFVDFSRLADQISENNIILEITVKDTGIGISKDDLETIFEPFKQTENSMKSNEGTGLGLSISRQFARLMGGDITAISELGQGSTFTCKINMSIPKKIDVITADKSQRIICIEPEQPEYKILVVEDIYESQLLMVKMLESVGFKVRAANNGQEAIALWQQWQPQLIWMDMRMPIMDGYEATKTIRAEAKNHHQTPPVIIIALTATAFEKDREAILAVGCNDFVSKPFREEIIFEIMEKHLGVKYCYEELLPKFGQNYPLEQLATENIKKEINLMSKKWIKELHQSALSARENKIIQLIQQIPSERYDLANALTQMLNHLAFEQIINLTETINHE
jgi:two-component system, chemotaxis family, sensor kinase Cph1